MHLILIQIAKVVGQVLLTLIMDMLTGKTLKVLLYKPIQWFANKYPKNKLDQEVAQEIKKDWNLTDADLTVPDTVPVLTIVKDKSNAT